TTLVKRQKKTYFSPPPDLARGNLQREVYAHSSLQRSAISPRAEAAAEPLLKYLSHRWLPRPGELGHFACEVFVTLENELVPGFLERLEFRVRDQPFKFLTRI